MTEFAPQKCSVSPPIASSKSSEIMSQAPQNQEIIFKIMSFKKCWVLI